MALNASEVVGDDSLLSRADRSFFKLESLLNFLGGLVIFAIVLLSTLNILGRWLFDLPIDGYIDWIEQMMAFVAVLGIAYAMREGSHIRMEMAVHRLRGRWLWAMEFLSTTLMLAVILILTYGSYLHFLRAFQIGDSSFDINLPTWPAKLVVPIAFSLLAVRLMLQLWAYARLWRHPDKPAVALPPIEDPNKVID